MATRMARRCGGEPAVRKGPWTLEEDLVLVSYISENGEGSWDNLARAAGLNRNGKSCRLRWLNYLRPGVRRGSITAAEDAAIRELHAVLGNKWSKIAKHLPGRTDNEIKNYWRTRIQKKLLTAAQQQPPRQPATTAVSDGASASSSGSASQDSSAAADDSWYMQPKMTEQPAYGQGAVAVATGTVKSEGASSSASASQDGSGAGDCWFMPLKAEQPAYRQGAMAVATGVVKTEGASSASASKKDGSSAAGAWYTQAIYPCHSELSSAAAGHLGMAGVDASTTQFFSSEFTDSFWNAVNNFWETVPGTGAF